MPKKNTNFTSSSWDFLTKEIQESLKEFETEIEKNCEEALSEAEELLVNELTNNTPTDTSNTKNSWISTSKKYKKVRYINNTALTETEYKGEYVPIVNLLEFSTNHGKPFARKVCDNNKDKITNIFQKHLSKEE
ncbi:MAG: HK97 gp10 family phage protein [Candidatus Caccovivens sp.]